MERLVAIAPAERCPDSSGLFHLTQFALLRPPQPLPTGRGGKKCGDRLPRAAARRLALPLGYYLIVLSGLRFALGERFHLVRLG